MLISTVFSDNSNHDIKPGDWIPSRQRLGLAGRAGAGKKTAKKQ
jgi:hypothetical protein